MSEIPSKVSELAEGMRGAIRDFEEDRLSIDRLAGELKSRIAALRQVADEAWADELKGIWNQLEMVNAFFIESKKDYLSEAERREVEEILDELLAALVVY